MVRFTSLKGSDLTITLLARAGPTVGAPVPYLGRDSTEGRTATPRPELMSSLPDLICSVDWNTASRVSRATFGLC